MDLTRYLPGPMNAGLLSAGKGFYDSGQAVKSGLLSIAPHTMNRWGVSPESIAWAHKELRELQEEKRERERLFLPVRQEYPASVAIGNALPMAIASRLHPGGVPVAGMEALRALHGTYRNQLSDPSYLAEWPELRSTMEDWLGRAGPDAKPGRLGVAW